MIFQFYVHTCVLSFADLPDSPKHLQVTDITRSYMTMTWEMPQKDGGSPITGYVIERCQLPGSRWTRLNKENVPDTVYTATDLVEGTEYKFRVAAENAAGVGPPSEPTGPIKAKDPYGKHAFIMSSYCF